jgi:uncharacterized protein (TIGR03435 family)
MRLTGQIQQALRPNLLVTLDPLISRPADAAESDAPPLFTALRDQLGLRLKPTKAPVEVILIDHTDPPRTTECGTGT